jgi:hypothetical protein
MRHDLTFEEALERFLELAQKLIDAHYAQSYPTLKPTKLSTMRGKKYIRIVATRDGGEGHRSSWGFINKENGDILKSASWKAPAKHARGNIHDDNPIDNVTPYGPNYLV